MMQQYAARAVQVAGQRKLQLDYSEQSLEKVEALLTEFSSSNSENPDELSRLWGGYFGEVVRRRFGGEWTIEKYPAGDFLIITLNVNGARLYPAMKVHRRLTNGEGENLWNFYQDVRKKLLALPGAKVQ